MAIIIKQAKQSDLVKIAHLFNAYRVFYKQESDYDVALSFITKRFNNSESIMFYAIDSKGEYLGFTQLFPCFSSVSAQRSWILNDLFVSKSCRSAGIGTLLLNKAKDYAIKTKSKGIGLETSADNTGAQALYESLGYKKIPSFPISLKYK